MALISSASSSLYHKIHTFHLAVFADVGWSVGAFSGRVTLLFADTARSLEHARLGAFSLGVTALVRREPNISAYLPLLAAVETSHCLGRLGAVGLGVTAAFSTGKTTSSNNPPLLTAVEAARILTTLWTITSKVAITTAASKVSNPQRKRIDNSLAALVIIILGLSRSGIEVVGTPGVLRGTPAILSTSNVGVGVFIGLETWYLSASISRETSSQRGIFTRFVAPTGRSLPTTRFSSRPRHLGKRSGQRML